MEVRHTLHTEGVLWSYNSFAKLQVGSKTIVAEFLQPAFDHLYFLWQIWEFLTANWMWRYSVHQQT